MHRKRAINLNVLWVHAGTNESVICCLGANQRAAQLLAKKFRGFGWRLALGNVVIHLVVFALTFFTADPARQENRQRHKLELLHRYS